jgi:hypothetical protein
VVLVANSTFEGTFYFSQASRAVDIPHREEKKALFCGLFPHFLTSPPVSELLLTVRAQGANIGVKKSARNFPECLLENENLHSEVM